MSGWRLRFYRRKRIAPGVVLNFSRSGVSTTLGPRHAHVTLGRQGVRETVGLPDSGLYATKFTPFHGASLGRASQRYAAPRLAQRRNATSSLVAVAAGGFLRGILWVVLACGVLGAIGAFIGR